MSDPIILPFCGAAPTLGDLAGRWTLDPLLLAFLVLLPAIRYAALPAGAPGAGDRWFWAGWAVLVVAFVSPLCALTVALFSARVVHHLLLVVVAAPLLALSNPWKNRRLRGSLGLWLGLHALTMWLWHAPLPYEMALRSDVVYWAMQASLLATAILFWTRLFDPRTPPIAAAAVSLAAMMQMGFLGALITFTPRPLYAAHALTTEAFGLTPLADQQLAGLIMWAPGALPYLLVTLVSVASIVRPSPSDGRS